MLIQPSQADVRRFFLRGLRQVPRGPLEAIETMASLWIAEHPEYHAELADVDAALRNMGDARPEQTPTRSCTCRCTCRSASSAASTSRAASARRWSC
jgi:hypothetical protein